MPAVIPPPPAMRVPPPSHARAALVAAAPDRLAMAVPVDATPKVVATPIATVGPLVATATPGAPSDAPAAEPLAFRFACASAFLISLCLPSKERISAVIRSSETLNSRGTFARALMWSEMARTCYAAPTRRLYRPATAVSNLPVDATYRSTASLKLSTARFRSFELNNTHSIPRCLNGHNDIGGARHQLGRSAARSAVRGACELFSSVHAPCWRARRVLRTRIWRDV